MRRVTQTARQHGVLVHFRQNAACPSVEAVPRLRVQSARWVVRVEGSQVLGALMPLLAARFGSRAFAGRVALGPHVRVWVAPGPAGAWVLRLLAALRVPHLSLLAARKRETTSTGVLLPGEHRRALP